MKLITAKALTKRFRNREVVRGINLEIKQGEILALIGPNGAGKTTTILILIGILMPIGVRITGPISAFSFSPRRFLKAVRRRKILGCLLQCTV